MKVVEGIATVEDIDSFVSKLGEIGERYGVAVQALDARYVVGREHLETAVRLANRAVERGEAIADDRAVEILCFAAGRRQINRAMAMGVEEGEVPVVVVVDGDGEEGGAVEAVEELLEGAPTLGEYDEARVREFFDVSDPELEAAEGDLAGIVRERVALLVVNR